PVHPRHRDVHDDNVWSQSYRLGNCVDAIGCLAHNLQWGFATKQFAQAGACYRVVICDQNPQRGRDATAWFLYGAFFLTRVVASCPRAVNYLKSGTSPRYGQDDPCSLCGRALDVQLTTEQRKALLNTE